MAKIIQDHKNCIGCGSCAAVCPAFWEMNYEEGKSFIKGGKENEETDNYELEVDEVGCNKDAAESCPVQIIKIL